MSPLNYQLYYQRHLPHYQPPGATMFITFRLVDSLPLEVIKHLDEELQTLLHIIDEIKDSAQKEQAAYLVQKQLFGKWDAELDHDRNGPMWLSQPEIASVICDALHFRDGKSFTLEAYCVMPNHVHLVFTPLEHDGEIIPISRIMQSLKGFTAHRANLLLVRKGGFWQKESYDHVVRDNEEFTRIVDYVLQNPARAGLTPKWVYRRT